MSVTISDGVEVGWTHSAPTKPCKCDIRRVPFYVCDRMRGERDPESGEAMVAWFRSAEIVEGHRGELFVQNPRWDPLSGEPFTVPLSTYSILPDVEWRIR